VSISLDDCERRSVGPVVDRTVDWVSLVAVECRDVLLLVADRGRDDVPSEGCFSDLVLFDGDVVKDFVDIFLGGTVCVLYDIIVLIT
jgi:hypothetical protein